MKKAIPVLVLLLAAGGVAYFLLSRQFVKSQLEVRIDDFFDHVDGLRSQLETKESHLLAYFDRQNYDPEARSPDAWVDRWRVENREAMFGREFQEMCILNKTDEQATVEFTVLEGFVGDEKKNIEPDMVLYRYRAVLVYDTSRGEWLFRSLQALDEE